MKNLMDDVNNRFFFFLKTAFDITGIIDFRSKAIIILRSHIDEMVMNTSKQMIKIKHAKVTVGQNGTKAYSLHVAS